MIKLGFLAYLGLVIMIGKDTGGVQHKAYVGLHEYSNPNNV